MIQWTQNCWWPMRRDRLAAFSLLCSLKVNIGHKRCPVLPYYPLFSLSNSSISFPSKAKTIDHALSDESSNRWTFGGALPFGSLSQTFWSSASRSLPTRGPRILHHIVVTIITRFGKPPADSSQRDFNKARCRPGGSVSFGSVIRWRYNIPEILAFFEKLKACKLCDQRLSTTLAYDFFSHFSSFLSTSCSSRSESKAGVSAKTIRRFP